VPWGVRVAERSPFVERRIEWLERLIKEHVNEVHRMTSMLEFIKVNNYVTPKMRTRIDVLRQSEKNKIKLQFSKGNK
jgi:predicted small metal-binding protein